MKMMAKVGAGHSDSESMFLKRFCNSELTMEERCVFRFYMEAHDFSRVRLHSHKEWRNTMKKTVLLIVSLIFLMTAAAAYADESTDTCVYDPDILQENLLTRICWFYDEAGQKTVSPEAGYAGRAAVYEHLLDAEGRYEQIAEMFLDPDGNLMAGPDGYAKMTTAFVLHDSGPVCRWWYTPGDPENDLCGYTRRFFDADENPVLITHADDGFLYRNAYGDGGSWLVGGEGFSTQSGFASFAVLMSRTEDEYVERRAYFGLNDEPILLDGIFTTYELKMTDDTMEKRYYGLNGEPVDTPLGYACSVESSSTTEDGRELYIRYYDKEGLPATDIESGVHAKHYTYGPGHDQVTRIEYLDTEDKLTDNTQGYSTVIKEYAVSPAGLPSYFVEAYFPDSVTTTYFDKDGNPVEVDDWKPWRK